MALRHGNAKSKIVARHRHASVTAAAKKDSAPAKRWLQAFNAIRKAKSTTGSIGSAPNTQLMTANSPASRLAMMQNIRGANPGMNMKKGLAFVRREKNKPNPRSAAGVPGVTAKSVQRRKAIKLSAFIRHLVYSFSGKPYDASSPQTKLVSNKLLQMAMVRLKTKKFPLFTDKNLEVLAKVSRA